MLVATGSVASGYFGHEHPPLDALIIGSLDEDTQRERSSDERSARHDRDEGVRGRAGGGRRDGEGRQRDDRLPRGGRRRPGRGRRARRRRRGQGGDRGRRRRPRRRSASWCRSTSSRGRTTSSGKHFTASAADAQRGDVELRVYLPIPDLGRQFAAYLGTPLRARGYPPVEGDHALIVEVAPGLAIERVIDLALKAVPDVEPGIHFVERQFGVLEVHARRPGARRAGGRGDPRRASARRPEDALRPQLLYVDVIEEVTDQHAVIVNRNREASMLLPGQTLLVVEMTPALFAAVAANAAERVAPGPDARHRLDDRRRRPRLSRGLDRGYRARARRDHARARGCEREETG